MSRADLRVDVAIVGGGVAGLWLLDELLRRGYDAMLIESHALGAGQTICAQGIIHGGLKYTLDGALTDAATAIREMPLVWSECLAGRRQPDLRTTQVLSECCYLWRTGSLLSRMGMIGARFGLRVAPVRVSRANRPAALRDCPGDVLRLAEQVIDPASLLRNLAERAAGRLVHVPADRLDVQAEPGGARPRLTIAPGDGQPLAIRPRTLVLCAGAGNGDLRRRLGFDEPLLQRRPLHMVMLRGPLPRLYGHCTEGTRPRVTITSQSAGNGEVVWQVGGELAEQGVDKGRKALLRHAHRELTAVLPGVDFNGARWAAYRIDRAERAAPGGERPAEAWCGREGDVITAWPTKLALAPPLSERIRALLPPPAGGGDGSNTVAALRDGPRPVVADPPWETCTTWTSNLSETRAAP